MRRLTGMLLLSALFATAAQAAEPTTVVGDRVNVRGKPSLRSEVITQLRDGETVIFLREITLSNPGPGEPSRWAQIELPENTPVWISSKYVDPVTKAITADRLNVRSGQSLNHSIIGQLALGVTVKEIRTVGEWMEIETPKGAFAYVASDFLTKTKGGSSAPISPVGKPAQPAETVPRPGSPTPPQKPATNRPRTSIASPVAPDSSSPVMNRNRAIVSPSEGIIAPTKPALASPAAPSVPTLDIAKPAAPNLSIPPSTPSEPAASKPESLPESDPIMIVDTAPSPPAVPVESAPARILGKEDTLPVGTPPVTVTPIETAPAAPTLMVSNIDLAQPAIQDSVQGQAEIVVVPAPPVSADASAKRQVVRRGVVRRAYSLVSPTTHALVDIQSGRLINYLYAGDTGLQLKYYSGKKIEVSGEESLDKRWPKTPLIEIRTLKPLP